MFHKTHRRRWFLLKTALFSTGGLIALEVHATRTRTNAQTVKYEPANIFIFGNSDLAEQLQTALDKSVNSSGIPGVSTVVITPDGFTWKGAAGVSDLSTQKLMQPDDIFGIGSISKTFTTATVLKLVEEGQLSLNDTLGEWLPENANKIPNSEDITLRQMLNGSSGIYSYTDNEAFFSNVITDYLSGSSKDWQLEELVAYAYDQPRFSGPSSSEFWTYPDTGNILAALIVEKVTGLTFADALRKRVTEPLKLEHTCFRAKEQIFPNQAHSYEDAFKPDKSLGQDGVLDDVTSVNLSGIAASASGLYSSAPDVARFSQALFNGELLQPSSIQELITFVDEGIPYEGKQFGLGIASYDTRFGTTWGKLGQVPGYSSQMLYFPEHNGTILVCLVNENDVIFTLISNLPQSPLPTPVSFVTDTILNVLDSVLE